MTQEQKQASEAREAVTEASEKLEETERSLHESGETLIDAMEAVERNLGETRTSLAHALHKAKDAETVVRMLKQRVRTLTARMMEREAADHRAEEARHDGP